VQAEHAVAGSKALVAMRDHYDGRPWLEIEHCLDDSPFRRNVDRARCFIEYKQERPAEHGASQAQALAFAAGDEGAAFAEHAI
jgi:hypothetical protein